LDPFTDAFVNVELKLCTNVLPELSGRVQKAAELAA